MAQPGWGPKTEYSNKFKLIKKGPAMPESSNREY